MWRSIAAQHVESASDLMRVLHDAQVSNMAKYPQGAMHVVTEMGVVGDVSPLRKVEAHLRWSGKQSRAVVAQSTRLDDEARQKVNRINSDLTTEFIEDEKQYIVHLPHSKLARITPRHSNGPPAFAGTRPDQVWYRMDFGGPMWSEVMAATSEIRQDGLTYSCKKLNDAFVELHRNSPEHDLKVIFSLPMDGNVVEYSYTYKDAQAVLHRDQGSFRWEKDQLGRVYLVSKEILYHRTDKGGKALPTGFVRLKVLDFNPDLKPTGQDFELASLKLSVGTRVEDKISGRTYRVGDLPEPDVRNSLDPLSREAGARGFARQGR